jgi:hypothetical protein
VQQALADCAGYWPLLWRITLTLLPVWTLAVLQAILALHSANISAFHLEMFPRYTVARCEHLFLKTPSALIFSRLPCIIKNRN